MKNKKHEEVIKIAGLAMLEISDEQLDSISEKFAEVKEYIDVLNEVSVSGLDMTPEDDRLDIFRKDESALSGIKLEDFSKYSENDLFVVPKVIE